MNSFILYDASQKVWQRILSLLTTLVASLVIAFAVTGCFLDNDNDPVVVPPVSVDAPGPVTDFAIAETQSGLMSFTLTWSSPTTGGPPDSYEVYRSTTPPAYDPANPVNHIISIPVVEGQTAYTFIDDVGLTNDITYWNVSAKNTGGETPYPTEPFDTPRGDSAGFGNNFSAAMIFADDIGISRVPIAGGSVWTDDAVTAVAKSAETGLRPNSAVPVATLPYLNPDDIFSKGNVDYYPQRASSTWQGEWVLGAATGPHEVNGAWGDNLVSQNLTVDSVIRIEMVLTKALITPMTSYTMESLYGAQRNEVQGADGTTYDNLTAFVFASNARLTIQKLDGGGADDGAPLYDQNLGEGDGPGYFGGEVNVAGNFTYGFVWNLKTQGIPSDITTGKAGTWRITFSLDPNSPFGTSPANNTSITSVSNGVLDSPTQAHIDITVSP